MSEALNIYHNIPVNKMAASMFWKTPEWAELPNSVKFGVIEARMKPEEINIDYFKAPPRKSKGEVKPKDNRGVKFYYEGQDREGNIVFEGWCMVTGFSHEIRKKGTARASVKPKYWSGDWDNKRKIGRHHNIKKWWVLMPDKSYRIFKWTTILKFIKRNTIR